MVCGHKLIDVDLRNVAFPSGQEDKGIGRWKTGDLVEVDGPRESWIGELLENFDVSEIPADFCLNLVEA